MDRRELFIIGAGAGAGAALGACAWPRRREARMSNDHRTFVLVPGSWHGAWCWYKVIPLLERGGHRAIAVELPGHGRDWRSPRDVTLQDYVDAVARVLDTLSEPAVLVGHSRGGIVISQVAEARPEKVAKLIYLAAFVIPDGEPMLATAMSDRESLIAANLVVDQEAGYHMLKREAFRDALQGDCGPEDVALAALLLTPEPNAPVATPLRLTAARYGRVPKAYIECSDDRGISPALQRQMRTRAGIERVATLPTGHSPFLSAPSALVEQLTTV